MRDKNSNLNFTKDLSGTTAIEYVLIAALIAMTVIVSVGRVGETTKNKLENTAASLDESTSGQGGAGGNGGSGGSGSSGDGASGSDNANGGTNSGGNEKKRKKKKK